MRYSMITILVLSSVLAFVGCRSQAKKPTEVKQAQQQTPETTEEATVEAPESAKRPLKETAGECDEDDRGPVLTDLSEVGIRDKVSSKECQQT